MQYIRSLTPSQLREAMAQSHSLWGGGLSLDERISRQRARLDFAGPDMMEISGLIDADGALLGALKKYYFEILIRGEAHKAIGLGGIFTEIGHRRKGVAQSLITSVLDEAANERGCTAAILYSDIGPRYYERFGFRAAPALSWSVPVTAMEHLTDAYTANHASAAEIDLLVQFHRTWIALRPLATLRSAKSWDLFHDMNAIHDTQWLMDEAEKAGYLSLTIEGDRLILEEALFPAGDEHRMWATACSIARRAGVTSISGWDMPSIAMVELFGGHVIRQRERAIPMIASIGRGFSLDDEILRESYFSPADHF